VSRAGWLPVVFVCAGLVAPGAPARATPTGTPAQLPAFSGQAAQDWIEWQCSLGSRVPGTPAHAAWLRRVHAWFDSLGVPVREERFRHPSPLGPDTLVLTNLIASFGGTARPRLLLGAHWDSRPWCDQDPDTANRHLPVIGANDGASGVSVLLVLARILKERPPPLGVDLAFFDGEDLGREDRPEEYCLGSRWMAEHWIGQPPDWVLVLDMVGSSQMTLSREEYSWSQSPALVDLVFRIAEDRGYSEWDRGSEIAVVDDHLSFQRIGVPAIVLIGFSDPFWHTRGDVPAHTSPVSLARVGEVVTTLIYGRYLVP
jgi:glutaminyl-peptide cyclotransferase